MGCIAEEEAHHSRGLGVEASSIGHILRHVAGEEGGRSSCPARSFEEVVRRNHRRREVEGYGWDPRTAAAAEGNVVGEAGSNRDLLRALKSDN